MKHLNIIETYKANTVYEGEKIPALFDITFSINQGDFVCIIGPNGAGKTTLLETLNGLLPHTSGQIIIMGYDIQKNGVYLRKQIGYVPQEFTVDPLSPFLVKDIVLMGRYGRVGLLKKISQKDYNLLEESLRFMGIEDLKCRPIGKLSGGQLQKVMLARVLAKQPVLLLLDEPFSNLDFRTTHQAIKLFSRAHDEKGWTTLMVMHDLNMIPERCNRIIYLEEGRITKDGSPDQVLTEELLTIGTREG